MTAGDPITRLTGCFLLVMPKRLKVQRHEIERYGDK